MRDSPNCDPSRALQSGGRMRNASQRIRDELRGILVFIGIIWVVFLISLAVPSLRTFGVVPRTLVGLAGIPTMPFLHANLAHLLSNTVPVPDDQELSFMI